MFCSVCRNPKRAEIVLDWAYSGSLAKLTALVDMVIVAFSGILISALQRSCRKRNSGSMNKRSRKTSNWLDIIFYSK